VQRRSATAEMDTAQTQTPEAKTTRTVSSSHPITIPYTSIGSMQRIAPTRRTASRASLDARVDTLTQVSTTLTSKEASKMTTLQQLHGLRRSKQTTLKTLTILNCSTPAIGIHVGILRFCLLAVQRLIEIRPWSSLTHISTSVITITRVAIRLAINT
jgi:hypothetical protein